MTAPGSFSPRGVHAMKSWGCAREHRDDSILDWIPCDPQENFKNFWKGTQVDAEPFWMPVHQSMRVTITRNTDKEHGFVNGMGATVQCMRRSGVQVLTDHGQVLLVHPVTHETWLPDGSCRKTTAFPLRLGYSTTLHKIQGATLSHITIWMDVPFIRAALYVALSRVQHDRDWRFVGSIQREHCLQRSPNLCAGGLRSGSNPRSNATAGRQNEPDRAWM